MAKGSSRPIIRRSLGTLLAIALVGAGLGVFLTRRFGTLTADPLDLPPGTHVWAHRGTHGGYQGEDAPLNREGENSLAAFDASIARGFTGIELDIFFLGARGFVVKHDEDQPDALSLEDVFARCGRKVYYWLDFKNLDAADVNAVIAAFRRLFERYPVADRVLVESDQAGPLAKLRDAIPGLKPIYWIERYPSGSGIRSALGRLRARAIVAGYGFRNVSASFYVSKEGFLRDFRRLGLYVYTVNDPPLMVSLSRAGVRVLLTDLDALPPGVSP